MALFQLGLLAWVLFLTAISIAFAALYPSLRAILGRLDPEARTSVLRALSVAPFVGGLMASILCFVPKTAEPILPQVDHCMDHADGHFHFCLNHPPATVGGIEIWLLFAALGIGVLFVIVARGRRLTSSLRILRQLAGSAQYEARHDVWVIESDRPVALSVGILKKRTILSSGLLRAIPARLVEVIVAHERAHAQRNDGLWKLATEVLSLGHLPGTRRALERDLELACEQACDERAGAMMGDRLRVAEALVAVERLRQNLLMMGPAALAFGASGLTARVDSLLSPSTGSPWSRRSKLALLAATCALAIGLADPLHHFAETLLHYVLS